MHTHDQSPAREHLSALADMAAMLATEQQWLSKLQRATQDYLDWPNPVTRGKLTRLLEAENQARYNAALQAVAERREREREAAERTAHIETLKVRLAALQDTTAIDKQAEKAQADLRALAADMVARNAEIAAIRDELQAVGSDLPAV